ncbi:MAG: SET domain-containing protein-lysine N-methyltransferase [Candidatus Woesearchaeota archaeon]
MITTKSKWITVSKSRIHNNGVYARTDIPKDTRIIEYVGNKLTQAESDKVWDEHWEKAKKDENTGNVYLFELNKKIDIDGNVPWNTARLINHSCEPNCKVDISKGKIWIVSNREIKKGEEISYDYGFDLEDFKDHPCRCGSKRCVGYIVSDEHWPKLKAMLRKK